MKHIIEYIYESYESFRLNNLKVKYKVEPTDFIIEAPETYQESDIQQYLDDKLLNDFPGGIDNCEKYFGKNAEFISDVYFEYERFEHMNADFNPSTIHIKWDARHNDNGDETTLNYFKVTKLKYNLIFDHFDLLDNNNSDENIKNTLITIFKSSASNNENKFPVKITFDETDIEYSK
jgi:hypothetical protein